MCACGGIYHLMVYGVHRADVAKAGLLALLFILLLVLSILSLFFGYMRMAGILLVMAILLPICLKMIRQRKLAKKRQRRMLLPLSM
mgnify:CR=1 FL=1